ncbi:MAG TPA: hypothetical protein VMZ53_30630 [Kofleriaceae bacterium]|nr:hypothetical protein [Kofleriaceae bacterium]
MSRAIRSPLLAPLQHAVPLHLAAPLLALFAAAACTGSIDDTARGDDNSDGPDAGIDLGPGDHEAVARAKLWVDAKVPYCQAPNHQRDYDEACMMTCTRPDVAAWDPYRSDCSGLVSWSWGLPPPGRTTSTLAPYNTDVSHSIDAADLQPGDAINNDHHTMIFVGWLEPMTKARFYEEPGCSSSQPYARQYDASVMMMAGKTIVLTYRGTYTAIRQTK